MAVNPGNFFGYIKFNGHKSSLLQYSVAVKILISKKRLKFFIKFFSHLPEDITFYIFYLLIHSAEGIHKLQKFGRKDVSLPVTHFCQAFHGKAEDLIQRILIIGNLRIQ